MVPESDNGAPMVRRAASAETKVVSGHGAGLADLWGRMLQNPLTVGAFLWVLADEGVVRTDRDGALDTDGTFLRAVRSQVGAQLPLGAVLDFHANLSAAMVEASWR